MKQSGNWSNIKFYRSTKRVDGSNSFYSLDTGGFTERQTEIYKGNAHLNLPWVYDHFTEQYIYDYSVTTVTDGEVHVNCGGVEYYIYTVKGNTDCTDNYGFGDYGIFTKKGTGFDDYGEIDIETLDPIYAYSLTVTVGDEDYELYGLVLDGKNYISDPILIQENKIIVKIGKEDYVVTDKVRAGIQYLLIK
jgi:hypothetical protein